MDVIIGDINLTGTASLNFEEWYLQAEQKNPILAYIKQEVVVSQKQVSLNKAKGLPHFGRFIE
jgi:HKD family nuclease